MHERRYLPADCGEVLTDYAERLPLAIAQAVLSEIQAQKGKA